MPDTLDRLIYDLGRLEARARVGALDPETALKLACAEFGTRKGEPPRPTLSVATDRHEAAAHRAVAHRVGAVLDGHAADGKAILQKVAEDLAEVVQEQVDANTPPPLAASTLAARRRRGNTSERTLVDSGEMLRSIRVEAKAGTDGWHDD